MLSPLSRELIDRNHKNEHQLFLVNVQTASEVDSTTDETNSTASEIDAKQRQSKRTHKKKPELFGGPLYLRAGKVNDLYRDVKDLYEFYAKDKEKLSATFPNLIRMSLRLLCEVAANNVKIDIYLNNNFLAAKQTLSQDTKTTLSSHNVTDLSIVQLLHVGAHNYSSANNVEQTIALSIIIGAILTITYGKDS